MELLLWFAAGLVIGGVLALGYKRKTDVVPLFVYGDMRTGGQEYGMLQILNAKFQEETSVEDWRLAVHIEDGAFQGMIPGGDGDFVNGDLYMVPFHKLSVLDEHLECWYSRVTVILVSGKTAQAYVFKGDVTWTI